MKKRGFFGIGCYGMKTRDNYGTLFRTAQVFEADFIFLIKTRFRFQATDTMKSAKHMPLFEYDSFEDFQKHRPHSAQLVGVELCESAISLSELKHPSSAIYLLGAEDHGLPNHILQECQQVVKLPGERSLNVSVAGSIVLYDRITKQI